MVTDPVTGYEYPKSWINACPDKKSLELAQKGLGILTSDGSVLKRGFTTGTTAAAACKAAVLSLKSSNNPVVSVSIKLPCNLIFEVLAEGKYGTGKSRTYSGAYKDDITSEILFCAKAIPKKSGVELIAGEGIGRYERDTPRFKKGEPAISKTAMDCILSSIKEALKDTGVSGVLVELTIPDGRETALKTLNPKIGIKRGISVLGSTGLVEPWDDHLTESAIERIKGYEKVVLTTGRVGLRYSRLMFPNHEVVLVGKYMEKGIIAAENSKEVILCGLPALIMKFIDPDILKDTKYCTVEDMSVSQGWERIVRETFSKSKKKFPDLRVVLIDRNGVITGDSG